MNKSFMVASLLIGAAHAGSPERGYVLGSVAAVGAQGGAAPCGGLALVVSGPSGELTIEADENGDYSPTVAVGKYELRKVLDRAGRELRIRSGQVHDFIVTKNKVTRFDVSLDRSCAFGDT